MVALECLQEKVASTYFAFAAGDADANIIGEHEQIFPSFRVFFDVCKQLFFGHGRSFGMSIICSMYMLT